MKRLLLLVLVLVVLLPFSASAQRSKWLKKQNVRVATTFSILLRYQIQEAKRSRRRKP